MTLYQIVALYVALNLLLLPVLMLRVGTLRMKKKISIGDGDDAGLFGRIRTHGNFIETAPMALIGLLALAYLQAPALVLHIFGAGFFIGRLLHAQGMSKEGSNGTGRGIGAMLTLLTFLGQGIYLLVLILLTSGTALT